MSQNNRRAEVVNIEPEQNLNNGSATMACRLNRTVYDLLKEDAKRKGMSLNALINSIAKRYVSWEKYADGVGFIPLAKDTVRLIFSNLEERKMRKIADHLGRTITRELILLMFNRLDFNSIVSFMDVTSSRYGRIQHNINGDTHDLILHHGVNKQFSEFLAEALKAMAKDLPLKVDMIIADSTILSARIKEKKILTTVQHRSPSGSAPSQIELTSIHD